MKTLAFVIGLLFAALAAPPAWADALYDKCANTVGPKDACPYEWHVRADRKLNEVWKSFYRSAEGQTKSDLLAEQRAWNAYKEKSCNFLRNDEWGRVGEVYHYHFCRIKVIEDRIQELQSYFSPSDMVDEREFEGFRCLSGGPKNSIRLEWGWYKDAIPAHWSTSYVKYKNSSKPIHLILKSNEGVETMEGRPWEYTSIWLEVVDGKITGEYKTITQGALIYGFTYKDYRNGRIVDFSDVPGDYAVVGDGKCTWK
ncbi:MAG: DUF1311 domain-containing protein [Betaproteobacteria bacterium]|nr:DUF1311 domain-containing protein [Betaproteobacteria bacterium]